MFSRSLAELSVTSAKEACRRLLPEQFPGYLLIAGALLLPNHVAAGLGIDLAVSVLLAGQFVPKFIQTGKAMPAGMMSILSVIGILTAIVAWIKK